MTTNPFLHSDIAIPPGEYLLEVLNEQGISQTTLARHLACSGPTLKKIIQGKMAVTQEIAQQLEPLLGVPAHIWIGLEKEYQSVNHRHQHEWNRMTQTAANSRGV
jgi:HTH-type transcriptional regulator / antitoxin HigA